MTRLSAGGTIAEREERSKRLSRLGRITFFHDGRLSTDTHFKPLAFSSSMSPIATRWTSLIPKNLLLPHPILVSYIPVVEGLYDIEECVRKIGKPISLMKKKEKIAFI